ncbi:MAG: hypothetical protein ATN36_00995 [Epulopiscium sp. Nele67-Bin005]|nr:MAG: hypothetical protein ATN36_00995 [Epulopiscium sp. Nele67-Bin005]
MLILLCLDKYNKVVKLKLIATGLIIFFLSSTNFQMIASPFQTKYLNMQIENIDKIELFAYTPNAEEFLFEINEGEVLREWAEILQMSTPQIAWKNKTLPQNSGYKILLYNQEKTTELIVSIPALGAKNLFVGPYYIAYDNPYLIDLLEEVQPTNPQVLNINPYSDSAILIDNSTLLNVLWRTILWEQKYDITHYNLDEFYIPAFLNFENEMGCKILFTDDFAYAYIPNRGVISLSEYLQSMLLEQYILSDLKTVDAFTFYEPVHIYTELNSTTKYYLEVENDSLYYGLYKEDYITKEKTLLHTITAVDSEFFLLKYPYILLLDHKGASQYFLMLINQNVPEKHRYIEKGVHIIPESIAIGPQNNSFTYIINNGETTTLFYVQDYYQSPLPAVTGHVQDSVFLSDQYIVLTQVIEGESLICVYDTSIGKIIKYTYIPGEVQLIQSGNNQVSFAIQQTKESTLREGVFTIDTSLTIVKQK